MYGRRIAYYCYILIMYGACSYPTSKTVSGPGILTSKGTILSNDWVGTYEGVLPDLQCDSILTKLIIKKNRRYKLTRIRMGFPGEQLQSKGRFSWSRFNDTEIAIETGNDNLRLRFEPNRIRQLNNYDCPTASYLLHKSPKTVVDKQWGLIEAFGKRLDQSLSTPNIFLINGKIHGNFVCGGIDGVYTICSGNRIEIDLPTELSCQSNAQYAFIQAMKQTTNFIFNGDTLIFTNAEKIELLKFKTLY